MTVEKERIISFLYLLSGIFLVISEFLHWIQGYTPLELLTIYQLNYVPLLYIIPFIQVGLLLGINLVHWKFHAVKKPFIFIVMLIILNVGFWGILELLDIHSQYVWDSPGIYMLFIANFMLLMGILLSLSTPMKITEDIEAYKEI
jgi:hypothetical protein